MVGKLLDLVTILQERQLENDVRLEFEYEYLALKKYRETFKADAMSDYIPTRSDILLIKESPSLARKLKLFPRLRVVDSDFKETLD